MTNPEYTIGKTLDLKDEQARTLASPRLKSNLFLKMFYVTADILYGRKGTLEKFRVIEIMARYPYWAWENGGYHGITRTHTRTRDISSMVSKRYRYFIEIGREAQDNEQCHLFLLEELLQQRGAKLGWFKHTLMPRFLAFGYYHLTRFIFWVRPAWSFAMNAAFESHAEHEYMTMAETHPDWDQASIELHACPDYQNQTTLGDLMRRIALDERDHMNRSLEAIDRL